MPRGAVRIAGVALACLGAAACGSQTHSTTRSTPILGSTTGGLTPAKTTSGMTHCTTKQLSLTLHGVAGLGHGGYVMDFRNHGNGVCSLYGYPGVDGLNAHGQVVVSAQRTLRGYLGGLGQGATIKLVLLASGQTASAVLEGFDAPKPGVPCRHYASLAVTPPNETHSVRMATTHTICYPQIHPVVTGATGQEP